MVNSYKDVLNTYYIERQIADAKEEKISCIIGSVILLLFLTILFIVVGVH